MPAIERQAAKEHAVLPNDDGWEDPECGTMKYFGEGLAAGMEEVGKALLAVYSAVLPDVGLQYSGEPAFALSWSFTLPFGPETGPVARRRWHCVPDSYEERLQPNRFNLDAGFVFTKATTYFGRLGYGWVWHRKGSRLGLGVGVGSTLSWTEAAEFRPSVSPEVGLRYGACCEPGYWILTVRYDRYFAGESRNSALVKLGFDYW